MDDKIFEPSRSNQCNETSAAKKQADEAFVKVKEFLFNLIGENKDLKDDLIENSSPSIKDIFREIYEIDRALNTENLLYNKTVHSKDDLVKYADHLKTLLKEKGKQLIISFAENPLSVPLKVVYLEQWLRYAKKCKKVAEDFLGRDYLRLDPKVSKDFFSKLIDVCVLECTCPQDKINQQIYANWLNIKDKKVGLCSTTGYVSIDNDIINLLITFLSTNYRTISIDEINNFFENRLLLINNKTENLDKQIKYGYFLFKLAAVVDNKLMGDPLSIFIKTFVDGFNFVLIFGSKKRDCDSKEILGLNSEENLKLSIALIYQALSKKFARMGHVATCDIQQQLLKFKNDYEKVFPSEDLNTDQLKGSQIKDKIKRLPPELNEYFSLDAVNASSEEVATQFDKALRQCGYNKVFIWHLLKKTEEDAFQKPAPKPPNFQPLVSLNSLPDLTRTTDLVTPGDVTSIEEKLNAFRQKLDDMISLLTDINVLLRQKQNLVPMPVHSVIEAPEELEQQTKNTQQSLGSTFKLTIFKFKNVLFEQVQKLVPNDSESTKKKEEIAELEHQTKNIQESLSSLYRSTIVKIKEQIANRSWQEDAKLSFKKRIKYFFLLGLYDVNSEKLKALIKLNDKDDFKYEKDFFLKTNFYSLLSYGIIRWPWLNKEKFATAWSEQFFLLKIEGILSEKETVQSMKDCYKILSVCNEQKEKNPREGIMLKVLNTLSHDIEASMKYLSPLEKLKKEVDDELNKCTVEQRSRVERERKLNLTKPGNFLLTTPPPPVFGMN